MSDRNKPHRYWKHSEPQCGRQCRYRRLQSGDGGYSSDPGMRLLKPPYGRITGYDMDQGTIAFQIPNGDTPPNIKAAFEAAGLKDIPPTGSGSQAHLLVTKNFLFAPRDPADRRSCMRMTRRPARRSGKGTWPSGPATGIPMGYSYQGKQYILHAARGPQGGGAQIVAWTTAPAPAGAGGGGRGGGRGGAAAPGAPAWWSWRPGAGREPLRLANPSKKGETINGQ